MEENSDSKKLVFTDRQLTFTAKLAGADKFLFIIKDEKSEAKQSFVLSKEKTNLLKKFLVAGS